VDGNEPVDGECPESPGPVDPEKPGGLSVGAVVGIVLAVVVVVAAVVVVTVVLVCKKKKAVSSVA